MGIDIRGSTEGEAAEVVRVCFSAFGKHPSEEELADELRIAEPDRLLGAVDGGRWVGSAGAYSFAMTVPGGASVPVAGVTLVGVLPTHRRQGILRGMMALQLDDIAARGEAVAVLTASDAGIYGHFGYGLASRLAKVAIDTRGGLPLVAEPAVGGRFRLLDAEDHSRAVAPVYEAARRTRVGELARSDAWWAHLQLDREVWREGASARFCVVHEDDDGVVDGYCWYRVKEVDTDDAVGRNEVQLWDLAAADAEVEAALLVYLAGIDLTTAVTGWVRPVDDPWPLRLADARRYRVDLVHDHLYVRLLDVPAALAARTYSAAGALVLAVDDRARPAAGGRFRLTVADDGTATCERVGGSPRGRADLRLDAAALGSLHLGGVAPSVLAAAGRLVASSPGALALADRAFLTARAPFCTQEF
jgi:predicted acetyltransferase